MPARRLATLALLAVMLLTVYAYGQEPPPVQPACLDLIGVRELLSQHDELTGAGVTVGIVELPEQSDDDQAGYAFMPNFEHRSLADVSWCGFYYYDRPVRYSAHASVIAGTLFGRDDSGRADGLGGFTYRGIVPEARAQVYETNWFIYRQVIGLEQQTPRPDVLTLSWGTNADDELTRLWQRGIDALAERDGCVIAASSGNGGQFKGISKPAWGYNVISVGTGSILGEGAEEYVGRPGEEFSSFGPTGDGRCKPDIIAPGVSLGPRADREGGYWCDRGAAGYSSFATPQVAGAAALLINAARQGGYVGGDDPRVVKALLLNGANKLTGWHKGRPGGGGRSFGAVGLPAGGGVG